MFVRFVLVWICRFPLPLGVWEGLRFVIVALAGIFLYLFFLKADHVHGLLYGLRQTKMCLRKCIKCTAPYRARTSSHLGNCTLLVHSIVSRDSGPLLSSYARRQVFTWRGPYALIVSSRRTHSLKDVDTLGILFAITAKEDTFCDFLFTLLHANTFLKKRLRYMKEKIHSTQRRPLLRLEQKQFWQNCLP